MPRPSSATRSTTSSPALTRTSTVRGLRVPAGVRQGLPEDGQQVGGQVVPDERPDRALEAERRPELERAPRPGPPAASTSAWMSCEASVPASAKIDRRMSLMVPSRSSTAWSSRGRDVGHGRPAVAAPCRPSPTANSRWMTTSCSSRPMRSRSSSIASRSLFLAGPDDLQGQGGLLGEARRQGRVQE